MRIWEERTEAGNGDVQSQQVKLRNTIPDVRLWVEHRDDEDLRLDDKLKSPFLHLCSVQKTGRSGGEQMERSEQGTTHDGALLMWRAQGEVGLSCPCLTA